MKCYVNIACALRWGVALIGGILGVIHPLWDNILGAGYTLVDNAQSRP